MLTHSSFWYPWEAGSQCYFIDKEAGIPRGEMPYPGSHNYRLSGVLGMGQGVRNPCLGPPGSQMGPPPHEITLYVKTLLESCSIAGKLWDCWEKTLMHGTFSGDGFRTCSHCLLSWKYIQFRDRYLAQMTLPVTMSLWQLCLVRKGQKQETKLSIDILICVILASAFQGGKSS